MQDHGSPALRRLLESLPDAVVATHAELGDATACVEPARIVEVARLLRDAPDPEREMLTALTAVDYFGEEPRFEVVYHFYSVARNHRVRVKARVPEDAPELPSLVDLYASADWMEREVFDMYGVRFSGHPRMERILLYDGFEGYPLRKDYAKAKRQPLVGPQN